MLDYSPEEIERTALDLAAELKAKKKAGIPHRLFEGKNIALIFEKTSTRTRCSFEVAAADLGMHSVYLDPQGLADREEGEHCRIPPGCWAACYDGIEYRGFGQEHGGGAGEIRRRARCGTG